MHHPWLKLIFYAGFLYILASSVVPFTGKVAIDLVLILLACPYIYKLATRRAASKLIGITREILFGVSGFYLAFIAVKVYRMDFDVITIPNDSWLGLVEAWFIIALAVVFLSSKKILRFFIGLPNSPARLIAVAYTLAALAGALVLVLPPSLQSGVSISYLDALFTTVSALSGTGLVVSNTATTYSYFGFIVLMLLMQIGGIGIITFSGILLLLIGQELGLGERAIQDDTERLYHFGTLKEFALSVTLIMFIFETLGAIILYPWMIKEVGHPGLAIIDSYFHSISAFCTAGFTTLPEGMVQARDEMLPLLTLGFLSFVGMLGLPVILGISKYIFRPKEYPRKISPYAKLELILASIFFMFGLITLFIVEIPNPDYLGWSDRILNSFFLSTQRNGGFNSMPLDEISPSAVFVMISLMVVGGAPMSTAGGVKTSTIGVIVLTIISFLRGKEQTHFAGRSIPPALFLKAVSLVTLFLAVVFVGFVLLVLTHPHSGVQILFETVSALTVTGWSLGITSDLNTIGKIIIIAMMLIGRLGFITFVYVLISNPKPDNYRHPQGEFYVG